MPTYLYNTATNEVVIRLGKIAKKFLVVSTELARFLVDRGLDDFRVDVSPNGVSQSFFEAPPDQAIQSLKEDKGIEKIILYIGSLRGTDDRIDFLVKAIPSVLKEHPNTLFLIVGDQNTYIARMAAYEANKLGVGRHMVFLGRVQHSRISRIIAASDLCIGLLWPNLISRFSCPLKIIEYMACGKPIVSFPTSADVLEDEVNCLLLRNQSLTEIADKIQTLLSDKALSIRLGSNAKAKALDRFCWKKIVSNLRRQLAEN